MTIIPQKLLGDCRQTLPTLTENSVHLVVTSPPYWRLRQYLPKDHPQKHLEIGNEPSIDLYLEHLLEVFAACSRVLRDDGTLWVNLGDTFNNNSSGAVQSGLKRLGDKWSPRKNPRKNSRYADVDGIYVRKETPVPGMDLKNLLMLPARFAMAMQQAGWVVRSQIPWIKRNPMPESVTDRPPVAIEYVYMFSKARAYYYDRYAVMKPSSINSHARMARNWEDNQGSLRANGGQRSDRPMKAAGQFVGVNPKAAGKTRRDGIKQNQDWAEQHKEMVSARNRRNSDWFFESWQGMMQDADGDPLAFLVNPVGTKIDHFASYPPKLIEPIILCGTSEKGCCSQCGAPLRRMVENGPADLEHQRVCGADAKGDYSGQATKQFDLNGVQNASDVKRRILAGMTEKKTVGWLPTCACKNPRTVPCTVLDPFGGTNVTGEVAMRLGRHSIMCELSEAYFKASDIRDRQTALAIV